MFQGLSHFLMSMYNWYCVFYCESKPRNKVGNKATEQLRTPAIMHTCICQKIKRIASLSLFCCEVQIFKKFL